MNGWQELGGGDHAGVLDRIQEAVVLMHNASGKALKPARVDFYVHRLKHLGRDAELWDVFEQAADKCECPSPAAIKDTVAKIKAQKKPPPAQYQPTDEERERSRAAALKTALWLHYEKGWPLQTFGATLMGSALKRQAEMSDAELAQALEAAKRKHSRESIAAWMR